MLTDSQQDKANMQADWQKYGRTAEGHGIDLYHQAKINCRKYGGVPDLTEEEENKAKAIYIACAKRNEALGIKGYYQVDHIIPKAAKGLHHHTNLQILTAKQNQIKGTFTPSSLKGTT